MEFLTRIGIERSRLTMFVMIGLLVLGAIMYSGLSKREDPAITIRTAVVSAQFPGMSPIRLEELVADPLERTARQISEIEDVNTRISTGSVVINLELYDWVPKEEINNIFQDIRNKMEDAGRDLPQGTLGPFVNTDYGDVVVATVAITGNGFTYTELKNSAKDLRKHLYTIDGIGKVDLIGEQEETIWLELDSRRLASIGVQISTVVADLQAQNVILPAGELDAQGTKIILEANGDLKNVEEIRNVLTKLNSTNSFVRLEDIVTIRRGYETPPDAPAYFNGEPAIMLGVQMTDGQDIQKLGVEIKNAVRSFEQTQPIGITYEFSTYQEAEVTASINAALSNVGQTILVVVLVLMVFLGLRSSLIIACIVPFTVMFALAGMQYLSIELQTVSIAAVIVSLGLLVDNGLVMVEDIQGRINRGESAKEAASAAGGQFALPLGISSITTAAAFLPLLILDGVEGEYGFSLGGVVAVMLLGSWLTAMYILPAMCVWFAKKPKKESRDSQNNITRAYGNILRRLLPLSVVVIIAAYAMVAGSITFFSLVQNQMFPLGERAQYLIYMDMPKGTTIEKTRDVALNVESWLSDSDKNPEVVSTTAYIGDGGPRFYLALSPADKDPASAFFIVNTKNFDGTLTASDRAKKQLVEQFPEPRFKIKRLSMGGGESGIVEVKITGPDADRLLALADQVEARFAQAPGIEQNENDWGNKVTKIIIDIAQDKARQIGVTSEDISDIMETYFSGTAVSTYREGTESIPMVMRAGEEFRNSLEDLQNMSIPVNGQLISLDQVATFKPYLELSQLRRENQVRSIKVSAKSNALDVNELYNFVEPELEKLDLSGGYAFTIDGEINDSADVNKNLGAGMPAALAIMLAAIIFQFNSFRRTLVTFMTIPLIIIGAPLALLIMGQPLSFFGILGLISLAGIILNNAIVLIDQIDLELKTMELKEAIISAGQKRFTPVMLTTLTTVVGLIPMALNGGALFEPMATLMIGGLSLASIITLFLVPSSYYLFFSMFGRKKDEPNAG